MPMTPFSLCSTTSRPAGRWFATSVGRPMPRLTTEPSAMSRATRAAISARLHLLLLMIRSRLLLEAAGAGRDALDADDALDEDPRRHDRFRIEAAEGHDLVHGRDRRLRGHRHHRPEVARRHP